MTTGPRRLVQAIVATTVLLLMVPPASAGSSAPAASRADFQGATIDLAEGWGAATACTTDGVTTRCFDTEREMDDYLVTQTLLFSDCGSSLRLYSDGGFSGSVLSLTARGFWLNLANYGFDNVTSSYSVGACDSYLADGAGGGGNWYPGATWAGASSSGMFAGWNDVISSVFIA